MSSFSFVRRLCIAVSLLACLAANAPGQTVEDLKALLARASALADQRKFDEASAEYEKAVVASEAIRGKDSEFVAYVLNSFAIVKNHQRRFAEAETMYLRSLKLYEQTQGTDSLEVGGVLQNLAESYYGQLRYPDAEKALLRSIKIAETKAGPQAPRVAVVSAVLGNVYFKQERYTDAEARYRRSLQIMEANYGPNHPEVAHELYNLSITVQHQGRLAEAEAMDRRSLRIKEATLGPDHIDIAESLNNLGNLLEALGRGNEAEPLFLRAIKIREAKLGPEHFLTGQIMENLALLYHSQGKEAEAEKLLLRVLKIEEAQLGEHPQVAITLNSLGNVYSALERYDEAAKLHERALKIMEDKLGPDHSIAAVNAINLGVLLQTQGQLDEAEKYFLRALKSFERTLGSDSARVEQVLLTLGRHYWRRERIDDAVDAFLRHARIGRKLNLQVLPNLNARQQSQFISTRDTSTVVSFGIANPKQQRAVDAAAEFTINHKYTVFPALAQRQLLARDVNDQQWGSVAQRLLKIRSQISEMNLTTVEPGKAAAHQKQLAELTDQEAELNQQLLAAGKGNLDAAEWVSLAEVRQAIPADSCLLEILHIVLVDPPGAKKREKPQPANYQVAIIPPAGQGEVQLIDLGVADEIDTLIQGIRQQIQADGGPNGRIRKEGHVAAVAALEPKLRELSEHIWKPLAPGVKDAKRLILSPDGELFLVPWATLPIEVDGNEQLLIEKYELRYVISGRELVEKRASQVGIAPPVIFADPAFTIGANDKQAAIGAVLGQAALRSVPRTPSAGSRSAIPKVGPLPGTDTEARLVQPNLEHYAQGQKATIYSERYALESIAKKLQRPRVALFATHGFFLPDQQAAPTNSTAQSDGAVAGDILRSAPAVDTTGNPLENPLLRCGLLLAGCNDRTATIADDDGILTGLEIVGIDFRGTDLVVLSACETGIGQVRNVEGVAGLRQAFQLAGANAVVSTLWQIPDRDSALVMNDFFESLAGGQSKAAALRTAQLKRLNAHRERDSVAHPFYWAAWTVTGQ